MGYLYILNFENMKKMEFIFRYYNNCIAITAQASASASA